MRLTKINLLKPVMGILSLVFLIQGNTHAAVWALWVGVMFSVEIELKR